MNIEEERKAFDEWEKSGMPDIGPWQAWLAAKTHAEEMAKPVARVRARKDHHKWAVYVPTSLIAEAFDFETAQDAAKWARARGYRVVSE